MIPANSSDVDVAAPLTTSTTTTLPEPEARHSFSTTKPHTDPLAPVRILKEVAMTLAHQNGKVTADDLRQLTPNAPNKTANYGACFQALIREGRLVLVTYQPSQAAHNHGRRIAVYAPPIRAVRSCP